MRCPGHLEVSQLLKPRYLGGHIHLVAEISDFQGVGLATVCEVQAVVTFRGEHAVLEALLGDMTAEELL